ncbi:putative transcription activatorDNA-dependent ATPase [Leptomonas pyrrhocoris]|uniref:Putative transcription activatorDNA-dependent ATPase n=1 Tax=Leptomonas pyrrhocoris TaxID=157538 RepID=A0A0M9G333_LEPPY|nr:putative transcription activatorDNA-dependent ATPase [Leptomonas pyrrhocoris]KPA81169.1 putative transcription activatorDNA-dependent ATPase [Leptomonas pyrrhocoris]|eukprot:XP_015659608.1 putative transcription activatorDNA-dependent ATPase [Leptomonas pyrrhocoris]
MTFTMARTIRRRQDLHNTPAFEREMNDIAADELYEQLLLGSIRSGTDPNAKVVVEVYEGYVEPSYDPVKGAEVAAAHREIIREIYKERDVIIRTLRSSDEHQQLSPFDRLLRETEFYTGVREWKGGAARSGKRSHLYRHASNDNEEDSTGFDMMHLTETPSYIRGKLRPYQIEGVNWLLGLFSRGVNGILADEMGLGKTFQTIAAIAYLKFTVGMPGPHLVVCPKSVLGNWYREFKHWCPSLSVYKFHASGDLRPSLVKAHLQPPDHIKYDVIVTTFEMILDEISTFKRVAWQYLIVDEAHKLKNEEGRAHTALDSLQSSHRLIITGTPLQNNLKELWALLHFLAPRLFNDSESFDAWFDTASGHQDASVMSNLHKILAPLMIRRLKADVSTGIPPKKEIYVACQLSKKQREWYMNVLAKDAEVLNKASGSAASLTNVMMNLRKVINHPYLMDGGEEGPPFITDEKLIRTSGKMIILDKLLRRLRSDIAGKHKVLIFSQFTSMLNILEDYCNMRGFQYCRIDGNTSGYDRDSQMASFNSPSSDYFVFLLSTRAGGLGINLQAANHVVIYDSDWNPQMDLQAQDRAHRIGQRRSVRVYRFVTDGTVEEKIYRRALKKLYLDAVVVQQGRLQSKTTNQASKEELLSMIKFGAAEIFKTRHEDVTEADIDRLLDEGEAISNQLTNEARQQVQMSLASFQLGAEEANIYDFEGVSFKTGAETRILHIKLNAPVSQAELQAQCSQHGEVIKTVLHPNMKEALVYFRSTSGAIEAKAKLPYVSTFASRDSQTVVSNDMIAECIGVGEQLGRGHRVREPVQFFSEADVESMQTKASKAPPLKLPKPPKFHPYQLYNMKRLTELHNTEVALMVRNWKRRYEEKKETAAKKDAENEEGADEGTKEEGEAEEEEDDELLTEVEQEERERLLSEGFPNWTFSEYRAVVATLTSGKMDLTDYPAIAAAVADTKTVGEVRDYVVALLERGEQCIKKFANVEARIRKAKAKREAKENVFKAAKWKVESCEDPAKELTFKTRGNVSLDREIFLIAYDAGFKQDNTSELVRSKPQHRFNVWYQSRPENFFERRLHTLMKSVQREWEKPADEDAGMPENSRRRLEV